MSNATMERQSSGTGQEEEEHRGLTITQLANLRQTLPPPEGLENYIDIEMNGNILISDLKWKDPNLRGWMDKLRARGFDVTFESIAAQEMEERIKIKSELNEGRTQVDSAVQKQAVDLLQMAADSGTSDIHITIGKKHAELEFRVNGDLRRQKPMEVEESESLLATIMNSMVMDGSNMYNPGERQDARIGHERFLPPSLGSVRIASGPTANDGRYMILRLLYKDTNTITGVLESRLYTLGYSEQHVKNFRLAWDKPSGINIVAGETGSGKSTTLKHILEAKKSEAPEENFISVEDPPEYQIQGIRQIPVTNAKGSDARGEAFADVIRFCLRADPDKILIGEIRDKQSLSLAMQAARSGHGVSASLHANSAFGIFNRSFDLLRSEEVPDPAQLLADETIMTGLIFQSLVKKTCQDCAYPLEGNEHRLRPDRLERLREIVDEDQLKSVRIRNPQGCDRCDRGAKGRTVVAEVVVTDAEMMDLLKTEGIASAKRYWMEVQGGITAVGHALEKVLKGEVSLDEAERKIGPINTDHVNAQRHKRQQVEAERQRVMYEQEAHSSFSDSGKEGA